MFKCHCVALFSTCLLRSSQHQITTIEPEESCEHSQLGVLTFGLNPNSASQIAQL